jgi:hypothetical protein
MCFENKVICFNQYISYFKTSYRIYLLQNNSFECNFSVCKVLSLRTQRSVLEWLTGVPFSNISGVLCGWAGPERLRSDEELLWPGMPLCVFKDKFFWPSINSRAHKTHHSDAIVRSAAVFACHCHIDFIDPTQFQ